MFQEGFPDYLRDDVTKVVGLIPNKTYNHATIGVSHEIIHYHQNQKVIRFPYRIYCVDPSDEVIDSLSERQKVILHCIYSRICEGLVRQKHMYSLLQMDYEDWAIPYILKICDEYIVEIVEMIYDILKDEDTERIKEFCIENNEAFCKSYNRMASYWNAYYRAKYSNFQQYIGRKLFRDCSGYSKAMQSRRSPQKS